MNAIREQLSLLFPVLATDPEFISRLTSESRLVTLPKAQLICLEGTHCEQLAFILSGSARVYKLGESGREITLYRIHPGECCILTLSCIIGENRFPAFAITEKETQAIIVPAARIRKWTDEIRVWRRYSWNLIAQRLGDVISLVEEITFKRMDERLLFYLSQKDKFPLGEKTPVTHQQIASELGTSREVISRLLKDLEQKGLVKSGRGWIEVRQAPM